MFDEYVSLGFNCEPAFQIRRVLGRDDSSFFSWGVFTIDSVISLIEARMVGAYDEASIGWDADWALARDQRFGFNFHGPWTYAGDPQADPNFAGKLWQQRAKAQHLAAKFFEPRGKRLYIYQPLNTQPREKVERLAELLAEINPDAELLLIRLSYETSSGATHPMIRERALKRAAPVADAPDGHLASWDAIFAEFPHRDLIRERIAA